MRVEQVEPRHIAELCSLLGYSRQSYYKRLREKEHQELSTDLIIGEVVRLRHTQPKSGGRKLQVMLQSFIAKHRMAIGRDKFFDLLRTNYLLVKRKRSK